MSVWRSVLLAILAVLLQVNVVAVWPVFGGVPHLIALGSVPFALLGGSPAGLTWVIVGAGFIDLLMPTRFGVTLVPLLLLYGLLRVLARHVVNTPTWWSITLLAVVVVAGTELILAIATGNWPQYGRDLLAAAVIAFPMGVFAGQVVTTRHSGLRIR